MSYPFHSDCVQGTVCLGRGQEDPPTGGNVHGWNSLRNWLHWITPTTHFRQGPASQSSSPQASPSGSKLFGLHGQRSKLPAGPHAMSLTFFCHGGRARTCPQNWAQSRPVGTRHAGPWLKWVEASPLFVALQKKRKGPPPPFGDPNPEKKATPKSS